jgi:hypothetical protein
MSSQTDLDKGGTSRQWVLTYLGPSVGWVYLPGRNQFEIAAAGTYILQPDTSVVNVNVNGAVTIMLPSAINPKVPAGVQPALWAKTALSVVDTGGFATAHPITIMPTSVAETIMGLASVQITSAFGAFILSPNNTLKGWVNSVQ